MSLKRQFARTMVFTSKKYIWHIQNRIHSIAVQLLQLENKSYLEWNQQQNAYLEQLAVVEINSRIIF